LLSNPEVSSLFTTGRTKAAFAGKRNLFGVGTIWIGTMIGFVASDHRATAEDMDDVIEHGRTNGMGMPIVEIPPKIIFFQKCLNRARESNGLSCYVV
jgi:hypothetical protein